MRFASRKGAGTRQNLAHLTVCENRFYLCVICNITYSQRINTHFNTLAGEILGLNLGASDRHSVLVRILDRARYPNILQDISG